MRIKNIAFIINPISGTKKGKRTLPRQIEKIIDPKQWLMSCVFTKYPGHARELAAQFARMGFDAVVSVGGDGTLNEVASGLRDSHTALGILPCGSGNGFARHIGVPMGLEKAIDMLNHCEPITCDYGMANDRFFISTCGTGFDAVIAEHFAGSGKRGFITYLQNVIQDAFTYKPQHIRLIADGVEIEQTAFLVNFANASQWGYEAAIAPKASIQDGKLDIAIMSPRAILGAPDIALRLFTKSIDESLWMDTIQAKEVTLIRDEKLPFHIDGDPVDMDKDVHVRIIEDGIRVLVAKRY